MMTAATIAGQAKGKAGKHQPTYEVMVQIVKNVGDTHPHAFSSLLVRAACVFANCNATSSVSMNSLTLNGLVR